MSSYGYTPKAYGTLRAAPKPRITASLSPNNRSGPLGVGPTPLGLSTRTAAAPSFTQDQVTASLAANPRASKGGYEGSTPMPAQGVAAPAAPAGAALTYDYSADPILNQIQALSSQSRSDAQSNALKLKKQLAIDYGDPSLANQLGDTATAQAASGNPFGVRQQLAKNYDKGTKQLDEQYNQQNLFYSGARALGLGDYANQYQGQLYDANSKEQQALGGIGDQLAAALANADLQDRQAQQDAADRALQLALTYGIDPGQGGGGGGGGDQAAATPPPTATEAVSGSSAGLGRLPVGSTNNPLIYAMLGRKMDPRYNY